MGNTFSPFLIFTSIFLIFILLPGFSLSWDDINETNLSEEEITSYTKTFISQMDDSELLGQVLMYSFFGDVPTDLMIEWIEEKGVGSVKIFGWNVSTLPVLASTISTLQKSARKRDHKIPLLVATDQEGGWVRHVKDQTSMTPGNIAIGASSLPFDAWWTGYYIGMELHNLGINMNFAPDVDVYLNEEAHIIGSRAFSSDPLQTAILSQAFFKGMDSAGIICTAKHFPGHGSAEGDSHGKLPIIEKTLDEIFDVDLLPYRFLIKEKLPSVMVGHLGFPKITGELEPASISKTLVNGVLREKLNFQGIIITDDMRMEGAYGTGLKPIQVCQKAIEAGNDIVMLSGPVKDQKDVWNHLSGLMETNETFKDRVTESAARVVAMKLRYLKRDNSVPLFPDAQKVYDVIPNDEGKDFFFQQAFRSVTMIKDETLPIAHEKDEKLLLAGQLWVFHNEGKRRFPEADIYDFPYNPFYYPRDEDLTRIKELGKEYDKIIFCLTNPNSLEVLKQLEDYADKVTVLSALTPIYLKETPWVKNALAVYGTCKESLQAGFAALAGDYAPTGGLPISID